MHRLWPLLAIAFAGAAGASPPVATVAAQAKQQCFWASQVTGFSDAGPDRALVNIGTRAMWELTLSPGCPDVNWAMRIGIRSRGGERVCTGRPAELLVPNASESGLQRCLVRSVRKLSAAEMAAARGESARH